MLACFCQTFLVALVSAATLTNASQTGTDVGTSVGSSFNLLHVDFADVDTSFVLAGNRDAYIGRILNSNANIITNVKNNILVGQS